MIRFVVGPGAELAPDLEERLPGRGIWLSAERDMVHTALSRRLFARAARRKVEVAADLDDRLETLLAKRCSHLLGLARRAGLVTAGYEKVRGALKAERPGLVLGALDGADGGRGKIRALAGGMPETAVLTSVELGAALGRGAVVHAVLKPGGLTDRVARDLGRLAGFRNGAQAPMGQNE